VSILEGYCLKLEYDYGVSGELAWKNGIDLCPDALYLKITDGKPEELFPALPFGRHSIGKNSSVIGRERGRCRNCSVSRRWNRSA
jgi:hypothetical protein